MGVDKIFTVLKAKDIVTIEYVNEYEPFNTSDIWENDNENLCALYDCYSNGKGIVGKHWHEMLEVIYVEKGVLEITTANGDIVLEEGEMAVIGSGAIHGIRALYNGVHNKCLQIKYEFIVNYLEYGELASTIFKISDTDKLIAYYKNVIKYLNKADQLSKMKYKANILMLLTAIIEDENYKDNNASNSNLNDTTKKIMYYINLNYKNNITLNSIADYFAYTPQNVAILFKKNLQKTVYTYLTEIRLENAVYMILNSNKRISEIALECGFPNEMAFINKFKIKYNTTPNMYRKQQLFLNDNNLKVNEI